MPPFYPMRFLIVTASSEAGDGLAELPAHPVDPAVSKSFANYTHGNLSPLFSLVRSLLLSTSPLISAFDTYIRSKRYFVIMISVNKTNQQYP